MYRKRKYRILFIIIGCLFFSPTASIDASAEENVLLATYNASSSWYYSVDPKNAKDPAPSIGTSDSGVTCTMDFGMQYNVYLGEIDLTKGTPKQIEITYSQGASTNELINWNQIYIVLGENENSIPTRWWAGPYNIRSTGSWDSFTTQKFSVKPGTYLEWPDKKIKAWLHNSRVKDIHVSQVKFYGTEKLPEGEGDGSEGDGESGAGNAGSDEDETGNGGENTNDPSGKGNNSKKANNSSGGSKSQGSKTDTGTKGGTDTKGKSPQLPQTKTTTPSRTAGNLRQPLSQNTNNTQKDSSGETMDIPKEERIYLTKISLSGEPNQSTGSIGGGEEKEFKETLVMKQKLTFDTTMIITLLTVIFFFILGALTKYINFRNSMMRKKHIIPGNMIRRTKNEHHNN